MPASCGLKWTLARCLRPWALPFVFLQLTGICIASVKMSSLNRTTKDDVLLCPDLKFGNETMLIKWHFQSKNLVLLTIWSGDSSPRWIIPQKEYKGRLSVPDGKSLKITNLTTEDSGYYEAHIISVSGKIHIESFNLTVFDPVTTESNTNPWIRWVLPVFLTTLMIIFWVAVCYFLWR
ncbi:SLAM family member 6-like [Notamacropus eugenii]|uniref:SLAM family member 6-like n=1 Tax=Notamacropus eugenii TaxID=9315 RepID=UPI003B6710FE